MVLSAEYTHFTANSSAFLAPIAAIAGDEASTCSASLAADANNWYSACPCKKSKFAGIVDHLISIEILVHQAIK